MKESTLLFILMGIVGSSPVILLISRMIDFSNELEIQALLFSIMIGSIVYGLWYAIDRYYRWGLKAQQKTGDAVE